MKNRNYSISSKQSMINNINSDGKTSLGNYQLSEEQYNIMVKAVESKLNEMVGDENKRGLLLAGLYEHIETVYAESFDPSKPGFARWCKKVAGRYIIDHAYKKESRQLAGNARFDVGDSALPEGEKPKQPTQAEYGFLNAAILEYRESDAKYSEETKERKFSEKMDYVARLVDQARLAKVEAECVKAVLAIELNPDSDNTDCDQALKTVNKSLEKSYECVRRAYASGITKLAKYLIENNINLSKTIYTI